MEGSRYFVDTDTISRHLFCPICFEVFHSPTHIRCGHTFCQTCILNWAKKSLTCPQCRERFSIKTCCKDLIAELLVMDLKVKCSNTGCPWKGPLSDSERHSRLCLFHPDRLQLWMKELMSSEEKPSALTLKLYQEHPNLARAVQYPPSPTLPLSEPTSTRLSKRPKLNRCTSN